ncbi:MAG: putative oxidoreductase, family [Nocardia sp.]|uniref:SDR family NAD(P)-dependent oxidoreductase n=1 Tax=Nocardia sp. TaxID=1821 RepID=UPI00260F37F6|nr:SDR family oxidoreductase [Nocardia sp.]MCU1647429.1 putative oxidoreductase, family [Nocardia sp.]
MSSNNFDGKVAVITGAGSGIGRAMAVAFAAAGAKGVAADIDITGAEKTAADIGSAALPVAVDISDEASVARLVDTAVETFGRIDVLCNNAGIMDTMALPADTSIEVWDRVLRINLTGTFLVTRAVLPHMLKQAAGAIVNTASEAGVRGGAAGIAYTASKHGVVGITRNVAWAHANDGIRCNAILPGPTLTGIAGPTPNWDAEGITRLRPILSLAQNIAQPEQMADVAVFLASDAAAFINGAILPVDGGWSAG